MATRTVRPKVQNGPVQRRSSQSTGRKVAARSSAPAARKTAGRAKPERSSRRRSKPETKGDARIYWLLVVIAAVMASGFIYSLRTKINIHRLGQMESRLKNELDEIANRQRYEILEQQRAINPQQSESAARQSGLIQPQLSGPRIAPAEPAARKPERNAKPGVKPVVKRKVRKQTR